MKEKINESYLLFMPCHKCDHVDLVLRENAKEWKCPFCEFEDEEGEEIK